MFAISNFIAVIFVGSLLPHCGSARFGYEKNMYSIPQPKIEVFTPRGFRISIEDSPGIRLFAFHGNVNKKINGQEPGAYSKEVLHSQNGQWIAEDKHARLHVGDKIYYWVFIHKYSLGYQLDDRCFIIEELLPSPFVPPALRPTPSYNTEPPYYVDSMTNAPQNKPSVDYAPVSSVSSKDLLLCEETILNTTQVLINLRTEVEKLKKLNKQLIVGMNEYPGSKQIKLAGHIPTDGTALSVVQFILREKLDLTPQIMWAVREDKNAIMFEVPSVVDKYEIIAASKDKLKGSKFVFS